MRRLDPELTPSTMSLTSTLRRGCHLRRYPLLPGLLAALLSLPLYGQGLGKIVGAVTDPQGLGIAAADVTVSEAGTGFQAKTTTNQEGLFSIPALRPAAYNVNVSAKGFKTFDQTNVILAADATVSITAKLEVGSASDKITVSAEAPQVDIATSTLAQVVNTRQIVDLPLNGRNAAQLVTLAAGVVAAPNDSADQGQTKTFPVVVTISANGSRANVTNYMLDGGNNVDEYTNVNLPFPFPDALQEFSVETSNYSAEYGQNSGGVVNVITKSGTNEIHGDLFEYVRNREFNARNFFARTVDPLKRNQFGFTVGGPVFIPRVYDGRNRTFFFFGYQGTTYRDNSGASTAFVPTTAEDQGDFSALLTANPANPLGKATTIIDPKTGTAFPNNQIPVTRLDPAAMAFSKDLPQGVGNGLVYYQKPVVQNFNEEVLRVDHQISASDRLTGRYYRDHFINQGILDPTNLLTFTDQASNLVQNGLISETHIFTPTLLNIFTLNFAREADQRGAPSGSPSVANFGVNVWQPPDNDLQSIAVSGFFTIGDNPKARFTRNNWTLADDVHWVHGNHTLAFGLHGEISRMDIDSQYQEPGAFSFTSDTTNFALASFELGYLRTLTQGSGQFFNNRNRFYGVYATDSYRITKRFTLNYGLRWEPFLPWQELKHRVEQFSPAAYYANQTSTVYTNAPRGLLFPGDPGVPEWGVRANYHDFEPRVGFAWDVLGDGKTSVRGGAGIFFDSRQMAGFTNAVTTQTPFSPTVTITTPQGPFSNPYLGIMNPFPQPVPIPKNAAFPLPVTVITFDPSGTYDVPVTYNWNVTVERQLGNDYKLRASYVGSHTSHLETSLALNPAVYTPGSTLSTDQRRLFQSFSSITLASMAVNANFNSLQLGLEKRLSHGLTVLANYTWSKSLDDLPFNGSITGPGPGAPGTVYPWYFPKASALDYGPTDFDRRQRIVLSYVWQIPGPQFGGKVAKALLGDWQTNGIIQAQSGQEFTITAGKDQSQTGLGGDRGVLVSQSTYGSGACGSSAPCVPFLNPGAFALPAIGAFGNVGKGALTGPKLVNWDLGVFRNFPVRERFMFQLRGEYFNVLNHPNFGLPVSAISSGGFGSITSAADPRIAQLALKMTF
jgi:hypothetical protein